MEANPMHIDKTDKETENGASFMCKEVERAEHLHLGDMP